MQLNSTTDYAIRIIIYLAKNKHVVSSKKLSEIINVSPRYLLQIGAKLRDANLVSVTYGSSGGYALSMPPDQITLFDIIQLMEGFTQSRLNLEYIEAETDEFQSLFDAYEFVDCIVEQTLKNITIEALI